MGGVNLVSLQLGLAATAQRRSDGGAFGLAGGIGDLGPGVGSAAVDEPSPTAGTATVEVNFIGGHVDQLLLLDCAADEVSFTVVILKQESGHNASPVLPSHTGWWVNENSRRRKTRAPILRAAPKV